MNKIASQDNLNTFDEILKSLETAGTNWHIFVRAFRQLRELYNALIKYEPKLGNSAVPFFPADHYKDKQYTYKELLPAMVPPGKSNLEQDINLQHLVTIFSLLEALADEAEKIMVLPAGEDSTKFLIDKSKKQNLVNFLLVTKSLPPNKLPEFCFAREIRNCFIHNNGKFDERAIDEYKSLPEFYSTGRLRIEGALKIGNDIREKLGYGHYQEFDRLILGIGNNLAKHIKS